MDERELINKLRQELQLLGCDLRDAGFKAGDPAYDRGAGMITNIDRFWWQKQEESGPKRDC